MSLSTLAHLSHQDDVPAGVYKVPYSEGKFIKSVWEEYQVRKRGKCGEEYNVEKRVRLSNIIFPNILRPLGISITSSGEEGKGTEIMGKKINIKMVVGKNIKL